MCSHEFGDYFYGFQAETVLRADELAGSQFLHQTAHENLLLFAVCFYFQIGAFCFEQYTEEVLRYRLPRVGLES